MAETHYVRSQNAKIETTLAVCRWGLNVVQEFRCYFLDGQDRITAAEDIDAPAVESAVSLGLAMLIQRRQAQKVDLQEIEIWQGVRKVYP